MLVLIKKSSFPFVSQALNGFRKNLNLTRDTLQEK